MNQPIAVSVKNVSKDFRLPHQKTSSIKDVFVRPLQAFRGGQTIEVQHALKDISFDVKKGEFFGIVGRNGSGKSTLLKIIAEIYQPSNGEVSVDGRLVPFIELGVGFNPELTGRENVYLSGALNGFSEKEIDGMYDDIVEFAELEQFMDQKLKNYSSGMQVRLAFSVATRSKADILVLDEVLAVGDENFQKKCNDYFEQQKASNRTIVLVTHDMSAVRKYCTKAILINDGQIEDYGDPDIVAEKYSKNNQQPESTKETFDGNISVEYSDRYSIGDNLDVKISWTDESVTGVGVALFKQSGERIFTTNTMRDGIKKIPSKQCTYRLRLDVAQGVYYLRVRTHNGGDEDTVGLIEQTKYFEVEPNGSPVDGIVPLDHEWRVK